MTLYRIKSMMRIHFLTALLFSAGLNRDSGSFRTLAFIGTLMVACLCNAEEQAKCLVVHDKAVAIFISPADDRIESMKKKQGEEGFYIIADDAIYYQWQAVEFLSKRKFPYCFTESDSHEFITKGDKKYSVHEKCPGWCLILWNGKEAPLWTNSADMVMHKEYMDKAVDHTGR